MNANIALLRKLAIALGVLTSALAQSPTSTNRFAYFTVTDPNHRFVVGLDQQHFEIFQSGVRRPITSFSSVDEPMSIAIVSDAPIAGLSLNSGDRLIQSRSISEAIRGLEAASSPRKALVIVSATDAAEGRSIPGGILTVRAVMETAEKTVIELRNQYRIGFVFAEGAANIQDEDILVVVTPGVFGFVLHLLEDLEHLLQ